MDIPSIVDALRSGRGAARAVKCLEQFDRPLTERELAAVRTHEAEHNDNAEAPVSETVKPLLSRPAVLVPRPVVLMCVVGSLRQSTISGKTKKHLVAAVLPQLLRTFSDRRTALLVREPEAANELVDIEKTEKALGHLGGTEWNTALQHALGRGDWSDLMYLRCMEEVITVLARAADKDLSLAKETSAVFTSTIIKLVVSTARQRVAGCRKDTRTIQTGRFAAKDRRASVMGTAAMDRLVHHIGRNTFVHDALMECVDYSEDADAVAVAGLLLHCFKVTPEKGHKHKVFTAAIKSKPGLLYTLLGDAPIAGTLSVSDPQEAILYCLYSLGLTTTSYASGRDMLALLQCLPRSDLEEYWKANTSDAIIQLFNPFVNNGSVFTQKVAGHVAAAMARCFVPDTRGIIQEDQWKELCTTTASTLQNRCRSGEDRVGVMSVFASLLQATAQRQKETSAEAFPLPSPAQVFAAVKNYLESGAEAIMGLSWAALAAVKGCDAVKGHSVLGDLVKVENVRHMCLANAAAPFTVANDTWRTIQDDCEETEVFRPDGFLSLMFVLPPEGSFTKLAQILCTSTVMSQMNRSDRRRAAEVAIHVAQEAKNYAPLAVVLADNCGGARGIASHYVRTTLKDDAAALIALWSALTHSVFGLDCDNVPTPCGAAGEAVAVVAPLLLNHAEKLSLITTVTEVLLCCGHDYVVGADPLYFTGLNKASGCYRTTSVSCSTTIFRRVFDTHSRLLDTHCAEVAKQLCAHLEAPEHVGSAAGRGLAQLLTRFSARRSPEEAIRARAAATMTFTAILAQLESSVSFFNAQSDLDQIVSANDAELTEAYMMRRVKEMGLVKEYPQIGKLPKGMTPEDLESQKNKDMKAIQEARAKLREELTKRRQKIQRDISRHLSPLLALRTIGFIAPSSIEGLPVVYPFIHKTLVNEETTKVVRDFCLDACVGLLYHTPLSTVAAHFVSISARLSDPTLTGLSARDVDQIAAIASQMRQKCATMLPAALFCVLQPFMKGSFKVGKTKTSKSISYVTQQQLLAILAMNTAQSEIPMKSEAVSLFLNIIASFPTLYKTVLNGLNSLVPHIPSTACTPLFRGCFLGNELQRECAIAALTKFSGFADFRRALVVAFVMSHDTSPSVVQAATSIVKANDFVVTVEDLAEVITLLREFGTMNRASCKRLALAVQTIVKQFRDCQTDLLSQVFEIGGSTAVTVLNSLAELLNHNSVASTLSYLCDLSEDGNCKADTLLSVLETGRAILSRCSVAMMEGVAPGIQPRLRKTLPKTCSAEHRELHSAIVVVWMTMIAVKMNDKEFLESTLEQQGTVLSSCNTARVHDCVQSCLKEIASHKLMKENPKLFEFAESCLGHVFNSGVYARKCAYACGFAGVVQGLGIRSIRRFNVLAALAQAHRDRQQQRTGAMVLIEVLATSLGHAFDAYALTLVPQLLESAAERDAKISEVADDASKAVMRNMSDAALNQLIPQLVVSLQSDQTKKRTPALNFIGFVAYCSPNMLAHALPTIMRHITSCLFDANASVSNMAFTAVKRVAGVVSNREIQEHIDSILNAMRNPTSETESALDALLYTRFMTAIDPASLALLIPVVSRGLVERSPVIRGKASQIVAAMVQLVADSRSLLPYADELLSRLEEAALDPQVDVRATSAKAIASLAATLQDTILDRSYEWCFKILHKAQTHAEMAGAALVLVEEVHLVGQHLLFGSLEEISKGVADEKASIREGFLNIVIFAPATLSTDVFQAFLPHAFPWVLQGLADINERVRNTALEAGNNILSMYGSRNLSMVLDPLLQGVLSDETNQRQSSMLLLANLVIHLVRHIKKKIKSTIEAQMQAEETALAAVGGGDEDEEEANELMQGGEVQMESARDAEKRGVSVVAQLEEQLGMNNFISVFAALHVGRSEENLTVRTEVVNAWQIAIPSARTTITKIFSGIVTMIVKLASCDDEECVQVAIKTVEYTCARLEERLETFVQLLIDQYKVGTHRHHIGALVCLKEVIPFADKERVVAMGGQLIGCVLPSLQSPDDEIRNCAGVLFEQLSKKVGVRLIEDVLESQLDTSIQGVIEVIKVRPQAALKNVIVQLKHREVLTAHYMELLGAIFDTEQAHVELINYIDDIVTIILRAIGNNVDRSVEAMQELADLLPDEYVMGPIDRFKAAAKVPATWVTAVQAAGAYARGISLKDPEPLCEVYRLTIAALSGNETVRNAAAQQLVTLGPAIDQRVIDETLTEQEKEDVTASRRAAGKYSLAFLDTIQQTLNVTAHTAMTSDDSEFSILAYPKLFDTMQAYYLRVLDNGLPAQRTQAIDALIDLLEYTPKSAVAPIVNTIAGKCTRALFTKQDGAVVAAILRLCLELLALPAGGKERMMETALATAMVSALLCDSAEARTLAHRVTIAVLTRNPAQAPIVLGSINSKRNALDTPLYKSAVCRFISVVMRYSKWEKNVDHTRTLLAMIRQWWEEPDSTAVSVAAGSAVGALCMNGSVADSDVQAVAERALAMAAARKNTAVGGVSCIYSLLNASLKRVEALVPDFAPRAAATIQAAVGFSANDRLSSVWILRNAALLHSLPSSAGVITPATIQPLLAKVGVMSDADELLSSTACYVQNMFPEAALPDVYPEPSSATEALGRFDADVDDESQSATFV